MRMLLLTAGWCGPRSVRSAISRRDSPARGRQEYTPRLQEVLQAPCLLGLRTSIPKVCPAHQKTLTDYT